MDVAEQDALDAEIPNTATYEIVDCWNTLSRSLKLDWKRRFKSSSLDGFRSELLVFCTDFSVRHSLRNYVKLWGGMVKFLEEYRDKFIVEYYAMGSSPLWQDYYRAHGEEIKHNNNDFTVIEQVYEKLVAIGKNRYGGLTIKDMNAELSKIATPATEVSVSPQGEALRTDRMKLDATVPSDDIKELLADYERLNADAFLGQSPTAELDRSALVGLHRNFRDRSNLRNYVLLWRGMLFFLETYFVGRSPEQVESIWGDFLPKEDVAIATDLHQKLVAMDGERQLSRIAAELNIKPLEAPIQSFDPVHPGFFARHFGHECERCHLKGYATVIGEMVTGRRAYTKPGSTMRVEVPDLASADFKAKFGDHWSGGTRPVTRYRTVSKPAQRVSIVGVDVHWMCTSCGHEWIAHETRETSAF